MVTGLEKKTDDEIIEALHEAVRHERAGTARVIVCLVEFLKRRLINKRAYPSLFEYCTSQLGYSEGAAFKRIRVAKAAQDHPELVTLLEERKSDVTRLCAICSHLASENKADLLERACTMRQRDLEFFVAGLAPKHVPRDTVRALELASTPPAVAQPPVATPERPGSSEPAPALEAAPAPQTTVSRAKVVALTPQAARISFTADPETVRKLGRACGLLHCGRGNVGAVLARALDALLEKIDPGVRLRAKRVRRIRAAKPGSRRVPRHVQEAVWNRDGGRCGFVDAEGNRCCATTGLEFDHIVPYSMGGRSDDPGNVRLLCRLHNAGEARRCFGDANIDLAIRRSGGDPSSRAQGPPG